MMRRRRRRAARWNYADGAQLDIDSGTAQGLQYLWILPPARVQYLLGTKGRGNSLVFAGCHLWLDFWWENTGGITALQDVDFGVVKSTIADPSTHTPDLSQSIAMWEQPNTPATLASWDEDDDSGVDSWLWQHHIKGQAPANNVVNVLNTGFSSGAGNVGNQGSARIDQATSDDPLQQCRKHWVTQEWQPDVVIRAKRRLQKDEGILFYMICRGFASLSGCHAKLDIRLRTLTK